MRLYMLISINKQTILVEKIGSFGIRETISPILITIFLDLSSWIVVIIYMEVILVKVLSIVHKADSQVYFLTAHFMILSKLLT